MGKTYRRDSDEKFSSQRSGKAPKRMKKRGGHLKTLNSNVDYDDDSYDDYFDDEVEMNDEIEIRHNKNTP